MRALGAIIFFAATACFVFASAIPGLATNETHWSTNTSNDAVASDDERMMPQGASKVEALERVPALGPKFKQKSSQNVGNVKKALTTVLFHKKDPLKTLKSPWVRTLEKSYDTAQLSQLFRKRYGDGATVVALAAAKESTGVTGDVANKLWEEQLKGYLAKTPRLSPKQVFKELEIPTDHRVFSDPRLSFLERYIDEFNAKERSDEPSSLVEVLTSVWSSNDMLMKTVVTAKASSLTKTKALEFEDALIAKWRGKDLHPTQLLHDLKIQPQLEALRSASLGTVMEYISLYNRMHPERKFSLLAWLTKNIKENVLAEALVVAKRSDFTEDVAITLQKEQFEQWVQVKEPLVHAVQTLDMHSFDGKKVQVLEDFIAFYSRKRFDRKTVPDVLTSGYDDEIKLMETIVEAPKENSFTQRKALEAEQLLHEKWSRDNLRPDTLLDKLGLLQRLKARDFTYMETTLKYVSYYNKNHPNDGFSLLAWFQEEEILLAEALVQAKKFQATKDFATVLQVEQFEKWIQVEKPLERVLDKFDKDKFEGPKVQVLDDFIEFYNKKRPRNDQLSLLAALISKFGGDIRLMELLQSAEVDASSVVKAFEVEELLYTKWTTFHFNPADLLMLLKVPQGLEALENPYLAMVLEYSHKYNKKHAHKKFLLVDWFTQKIKEKDLAEALVKARKVKATESIATELQTELLNNWLIHGKSIDDVRKLLQLDRAGDAVPRNPPPMGNTP